MGRLIDAVYSDGVLRPNEPLPLADGTRLRLEVVEDSAPVQQWDPKRIAEAVERIAPMPMESAQDGEPVGREHDRYLYGDRSEFVRNHRG
jgi:predicted DNA-binding antitoxin AbrB/MazE fold protein